MGGWGGLSVPTEKIKSHIPKTTQPPCKGRLCGSRSGQCNGTMIGGWSRVKSSKVSDLDILPFAI